MKKLSTLFLSLVFVLVSFFAIAQSNADYNITVTPPGGIVACDINNTAELVHIVAKRNGLANFKITFTLPTGIEYVTGTVLKTAGPAGLTIAEDATSTATTPVFNISGTWAQTNVFDFTFTRRAGCSAINYSIAGGSFKDKFSASYTGGTASPLVDIDPAIAPYNINTAVLSVQTIATATANLGDVITPRNITVVQGGNGCTRSMVHKVVIADTVATIDYVLSYGGTPLVPASYSTTDTLYFPIDFTVAPFNAAVGGNGCFDNGETITFQESFKVQRCSSEPVRHIATYGCSAGQVCYTSASQPGNIIFGSQLPNITFAFTSNTVPSAGQMNICTANHVEVVVTNTNTNAGAAATDVLLIVGYAGNNVNPSSYDNPKLQYRTSQYATSNFAVNGVSVPSVRWNNIQALASLNPGGNNPEIGIMDTLTFDPDGPGVGLEDLDGDGYYDDLGPGQSFTFSYDITTQQISADNACVPLNTGWDKQSYVHNYVQQVHKTQCGTPRVGSTLDKFYENFGKYTQVSDWDVPTDIDGPSGANFTVKIYPNWQRNGWHCGGTSAEKYQVRIPLPVGITYDGVTAPNLPASLNPSYFMDGDTLVYQLEGDYVAQRNWFDFPLTIDCGLYQSTRLTLSYETRFICDGCVEWKINCGTFPTINTHCPSPCKGPVTRGFDANRTTAGWTDATQTTKVVLDPNTHNTKAYLAGDTMQIKTYMYMNDTAVSDLRFVMNYNGSPILTFLGGTIDVKDNSSGSVVSGVLTAPSYSTSGTNRNYEFNLSSFSTLVSPTYQFGEGNEADTVWLTINMLVPKSPQSGNSYPLVNFLGRFISINPGVDTVSCDYYGDVAKINSPYIHNTEHINNLVFNECGSAYFTNTLWSRIDNPSSFPGEYRPYILMNSITFTLPDYVEYIPNSASISGYYGDTISGAAVTTTWDPGTRVLTLTPTNPQTAPNFWSNQFRANIYLDVKCGAPSALIPSSNVYSSNINAEVYLNNAAVQENMTYNGYLTNLYTYVQPTFTLQSPLPISQGVQSNISWDVQVDKTSTGNTAYNWLRIEELSGIQITGVYAISGSTETLLTSTSQGGYLYAQLGGMSGTGTHKYRIKATYNTCINQNFDVNIGFGCQGYPTDYTSVNANNCYQNVLTLGLEPKGSIVEIDVDETSTSVPVTMCSPFNVSMELFSPGEANVENPNVSFAVPGGITGLTINSVNVEYPAGSGNIQSVSTSVVAGKVVVNLMDHTTIDSIGGIYGTTNNPGVDGRKAIITLNAQTNCNFVANSRIRFIAYGEQPCNGLATGSGSVDYSEKIAIAGAVNDYEVFHTIIPPIDGIEGCAITDTINFASTIFSGTVGPVTGTQDSMRIVLPENISYLNYVCNSAICPTFVSSMVVNGLTELLFSIPAGLSNGDVMDIDVAVTSFEACNSSANVDISSFVAVTGVNCGGTPCSRVLLETGFETKSVPIKKPYFEFVSADAISVQQGVASEVVTIAYEVQNNGDIDATELAIVLYYDANFNGVLDGSDIKVFSQMPYTVSVPPSGIFDTTIVATINAGQTCPLLIAIDTSLCACSYDVMAVPVVQLTGNAGQDTTVCSGQSVSIGLPPLSGYSYEWIGQLAGSGFSNPYTSFTSYTAASVTSLTYDTVYLNTYRPSGCASVDTLVIKIKPLPNASISPTDVAICQGKSTTLTASPSGTYKYLWSNAQTTQSIVVSAAGSYSVTVTDTVSHCSANVATSVTVLPAPTAAFTSSNAALCTNDGIRTLTGTPVGGTFIGAGVSGNQFNPSVAGVGTHIIQYAVVNSSGCVDTAQQSIQVKAVPTVTFNNNDTSICVGGGLLSLTAIPSTASFSGPGVSGSSFNPSLSGLGTHVIYAQYTSGGCTGIDSISITVISGPAAPTSGGNATYCSGSTVPTISATAPSGGTINWYSAATGGTLLASATTTYMPIGPGTYYAESVSAAGCLSATRTAITVSQNPQPSQPVSVEGNQQVCSSNLPATLTTTTVAGTTVTWYSNASLTTQVGTGLTYSTSTAGTYYAVATNTSTGCKSNATNVTLVIDALPTSVYAGPNQSVCTPANTAITVDMAATGTGGTGTWSQIGPNPPTGITGSNTANQQVDLLPRASAYQFQWCVTNGACKVCDTVSVTVGTSPVITSTQLPACTPSRTSYTYKVTVSPSSSVSSLSGTYTGAGTSTDPYVVTVPIGTNDVFTATLGSCTTTFSATSPASCPCPIMAAPTSGGDKEVCASGAWPTISATPATGMQINWYSAATGGTTLATNSTTYTPSGSLTAGTYTYYAENYDPINGCASSRTAVIITVSALPTAYAGPDASYCSPASTPVTVNMAATVSGGSGVWTQVGPNPATGINGSTDPNQELDLLPRASAYQFQWCVTNGSCIVCDTVAVSVNTLPSISFTAAQTCTPSLTHYTYSVIVNPTSTVGSSSGTYTGAGTATNPYVVTVPIGSNDMFTATLGTCDSVLSVPSPTNCPCPGTAAPTSGGNQQACISAASWPTISATPPSGMQVNWYNVSGGGTALVTNSTTYTPTGALTAGTFTYYAETFDPVNSCTSTRTAVTITISPLPTATAGNDSSICVPVGATSNYTLTGSFSGGNGFWSQLPTAPAVALSSPSNASQIVSLQGGYTYKFQWCVSNANCQICDTVTISTTSTPAITLTQNAMCTPNLLNYTYRVTVNPATANVSSTAGIYSGAGTSTNPYIVTVPVGTNDVFTSTNGSCSSSISLTSPATCPCPPMVAPTSGGNKQTCISTGVWPTLTATPAAGMQINWYDVSTGGTALVSNATSFTNTGVLTAGTFTFYAETQDPVNGCKSERTAITIVVSPLPIANAGINDTICTPPTGTTPYSLSASYASGTGIWRQVGSSPSVGLTGSTNASQLVDLQGGYLYKFEWCVSNANCKVCDTVEISTNSKPTVTLGTKDCTADITHWYYTINVPSASNMVTSLNGSAIQSGTTWTITVDTLYANDDVTVSTTAGCSTILSVDAPTTCDCDPADFDGPAVSGGNQTICVSEGTYPMLTATVPVSMQTGPFVIDWYNDASTSTLVASGSNTYTIPSAPVVGTICYYAEIRNTVTGCTSYGVGYARTPVCVNVSALPSPVSAGNDNSVCGTAIYTMQATGVGGLGTWTQTSGVPTGINGSHNPTQQISLSSGLSYQFEWAVVNGACTVRDTVNLVSSAGHTANAGNDFAACMVIDGTGSFNLNANMTPGASGGMWTTNSGAVISDVHSPTSSVTGLIPSGTPYQFTWTDTVGGCFASDAVLVTVNEMPVANAGVDDTMCLHTPYTLNGDVTSDATATFNWRVVGGSNFGTGIYTPVVNPIVTTQYLLRAAIGTCVDRDTMTLSVSGYPVAVDDPCVDVFEDGTITTNVNNDNYNAVLDGLVTYSIASVENGTASVDAMGNVTFTPNTNFVGQTNVKVAVCSESCGALCDTSTLCLNVLPVTDTVPQVTCEDCPLPICSPDDITDTTGITSVTLSCGPEHGTVNTDVTDGCITYTPDTNYVGLDTICVVMCTSTGVCDTTRIPITVTPVTDTIPLTVYEDDSITVCSPILTDMGPGATFETCYGTLETMNGTLSFADSCVTYYPNENYNGPDEACIVVCNNGVCDTTILIIDVLPVNDPPVAIDDINNTLQDTPVSGSVATNDSDLDGDPLTFTADTSGLTDGTLVFQPDGTYTFTPNDGFVGTVVIPYTVCDTGMPVLCDTALLTITVIEDDPYATNNPPVANNDNVSVTGTDPVDLCIVCNDEDPDGDDLGIPTVIDQVGPGTVTIDPVTGVLTFTPDPTLDPLDTVVVVTYYVCDNGVPSLCDTATVTIDVNPMPQDSIIPPFATDDAYGTDQDVPVTGNVATNDLNQGGGPVTYSITGTDSLDGTITSFDTLTGAFTFVPNPGYVGPTSFTYEICDTAGNCSEATVYITIYDDNEPPVAVDDINNTPENTPVDGIVATNDTDPNNDPLVFTFDTTSLVDGTLTFDSLGNYTFTPNTDFTGTVEIPYTVCDTAGLCDDAILVIEVIANDPLADNNPPVANNDNVSVTGTDPVDLCILCNDLDPDGDDLGVPTVIDQVGPGTVTIDPVTGVLTFTPDPTLEPIDTVVVVTYYVCDDGIPSLCDTATVTIDVNTMPDDSIIPPFAIDDAYGTPQDVPVSGNVSSNDLNQGGGPVTFGITDSTTLDGTITDFDPITGEFTFVPNPGFEGPTSFTYEICDTAGNCSEATVYITVLDDNEPPVAVDDINNTPENTPVDGSVATNDTDPNDDPLVFTFDTTSLVDGTLTFDSLGNYTFTPNTDFTGSVEIPYTVCDSTGLCDTAVLVITVIEDDPYATNNPPVANNDNVSVTGTDPVDLCIVCNDTDPDGDDLGIPTVIDQVGPGTVTIDPITGILTFTPDSTLEPIDTVVYVTYYVCDNGIPSLCDTAVVAISVNTMPDDSIIPPFAVDDAYSTDQDVPVTGNVFDNDVNQGGGPVTITGPLTQPEHGTVTIDSNGVFTYTPDPGYTGPDNFTYELCDTAGNCSVATVYVTIFDDNEPPLAINDVNHTYNDLPVNGDVSTNDSDPNGDPLTYTQLTDPQSGDVVFNPDGTYTYTPEPGDTGTVSFDYVVCDSYGLCDTATVVIDVDVYDPNNNNEPIAVNDNTLTEVNTPVTICIVCNDTDPDGDDLSDPTLTSQPENGTVVVNPDGTITYTPDPDFIGEDQFTYVVCDADGLCDEATVTIIVTPPTDPTANHAPVAVDDHYVTGLNTPVDGDASSNDFDPDNDDLTYSVTSQPSNGTLSPNGDGTFTYTPNDGFAGEDQYTYTVCDNGSPVLCDEATVYITVLPAPIEAVNDSAIVPVAAPFDPITIDVLNNDTASGTPSVSIVTDPIEGTVTVNPDGTVTYTPPANGAINDIDSFQYVICLNTICDTAWVYVDVPTGGTFIDAIDDFREVEPGTPIVISVLENDDYTIYTDVYVVEQPTEGTVTVNADGTITYTPYGTFVVDYFTYALCNEDLCDTATVMLISKFPDGISPNGDGINDNFDLGNILHFFPDATLAIYNRWGDQVWGSYGPYHNDWNGVNYQNVNLPDGTYFYIFEFNKEGFKPKQGFVAVYRNK